MRSVLLLGLALTIVTLSVYWQIGDHEFMILDDAGYVTENVNVSAGFTGDSLGWAFSAVELGNWHPVTWLSHIADAEFFGLNPRGHHLTSLFIHLAATLLLLSLLYRLTRSPGKSAFVAALFALHPLHVESVAWISERKDVLSAFFCWLTLLLYAEYVAHRKIRFYLLALFAFVLGLMSKPMLVTLPVVMLLIDFWPLERCSWQEGEEKFADLNKFIPLVREKIPFFVLSLASSLITIYAQNKGGAIPSVEVVPLGLRFENAVVAYVKYMSKMFFPTELAIFYPFPFSIPLWQSIGSAAILLGVTVGVIRVGRRKPYLVTGWFWFLITLLPVIGLVQVGLQSMADRYTYIPLTGLFIALAWGGSELVAKLPYRKFVLGLAACVIIAGAATLTWKQLEYWQDSSLLFQHTVRITPGNFYAHYVLGIYYAKNGRTGEAIEQYQRSIGMNPHHIETRYHLGIAYGMEEKFDRSIEEFRKIIQIDPGYVKAYNVLGVALAQTGQYEEAIKEFRRALEIDPGYSQANHNLGLALERIKQERSNR